MIAYTIRAESFSDVYEQIAGKLLAHASQQDVLYAVPGHPFVAESTVSLVVQQARQINVEVKIVGGLSFIEPILTAVEIDGLDGCISRCP